MNRTVLDIRVQISAQPHHDIADTAFAVDVIAQDFALQRTNST